MTLKAFGPPALLSLIHLDADYGIRVSWSPGAVAHDGSHSRGNPLV